MAGPKRKFKCRKYTPEFRVKVVKTAEKKKLSHDEVRRVFGINSASFSAWKKIYTKQGEEALRKYGQGLRSKKPQLSPRAQEKIQRQVLEIKRKYPFFGVMRVWQWMLRSLFMPVSYRQVRNTMAEAKLLGKKPKRKRRPPQPRRFERSRPNELWQSDITEIQLAKGVTTYLIGFMDDHSRYIVSWGLYAGYTSELVLEVLRRGFATYGRPAELLTDNGPPYKSWRGTTEFQKVLQREDVKHILARPHHPETLGKIESFWSQLKKEFVSQTKHKGDLEEMRQRLEHWMKWYNFQRYQTEIKCTPAERFFQYEQAMKAEIERRILQNEKDLALAETPPSEVIGQNPVGENTLEVRKEGTEFIVLLGDQEVNRMNVDRKEDHREKEEAAAGEDGNKGSGSQGQGVAGAAGAVGGEIDRPGMQGNGAQADGILQDGGPDGAGHAAGSADAGGEGQTSQSSHGGDLAGGADGGTPAGTPPDAGLGADLQEALPAGSPENAQKRSGEAKRSDFTGDSGGGNGADGTSSGEAPTASGDGGVGALDKAEG